MNISLVVLTCNRKDSVIPLLKSLEEQTRYPEEVIVVDNNSTDGTSDCIKQQFKFVRLVRLEENRGASGRNEGIKRAGGDLVITLDDDVFFAERCGIEKIEQIFETNRDVSVLNFQILDGEHQKIIPFNWFHPYEMERYADQHLLTDYISEGAVCFRREVFAVVGFYPEEFFISHEGPDLSYRLLDNDFSIEYSPEIKVIHRCSTEHRVTWRNTYYDTRNQIWLAIRNLPFFRALAHIFYRLFTTFLFALMRRQLRWYLKAVYDGFRGIGSELKYRKPISKNTVSKIRNIRKHKPGVGYKIMSFVKRVNLINKTFEV
ncbi:glycosyltransferase family 2 protein [Desulfogranum mediterraneum]|uniref:glycosyltransferase family 2 protein n=1 Tax=Desulfogranum mediterraneum TaxID=160661 RepID=UPI0004127C53|nr:glycosyltransferase family 2 protein [Desulfogranum mediterraneum]